FRIAACSGACVPGEAGARRTDMHADELAIARAKNASSAIASRMRGCPIGDPEHLKSGVGDRRRSLPVLPVGMGRCIHAARTAGKSIDAPAEDDDLLADIPGIDTECIELPLNTNR